jgi:phosphopentomutase
MSVECLQKFKPRVLYIAFGETDDWAHQRRYDRYLDYIHVFDSYLKRLWTLLQSMDEYRNNTTLIITTDHGRVRRIALPSSRETAGATGVESSSRG